MPAFARLSALPLLALPLALLLSLSTVCQRLSVGLDDALLRLSARTTTFDEVLAVDIDDASLRLLAPQLGDWPYKRDVYALLLGYLREAGVKVVVFDIVFAGAREGDAAFASALAQQPDAVLAAAGLRQAQAVDQPSNRLLERISRPGGAPMPALQWADATLPQPLLLGDGAPAALGSVGMISTVLDDDGRLRHLPLLHQVRGRLLPALPLAALLRGERQPSDWLAAAQRWPLDTEGRLRLRLPANHDAVPTLTWATLMAAALGAQDGSDKDLRQRLAGRALFVGSSAFFADAVMTPQGQMSGTQLLATAYATMGRNEVLASAAWPWTALLWLLAALPPLWIWRSGEPLLVRQLLPAAAALSAILLIATGLLARQQLTPLLGPLLTLALGLALTALAQLRWETLRNRQLRYERAVADAANQAKSEFLAHVSHEIRTPMNALLGMAELLADSELAPAQRRHVEVFQTAGRSLFALINDLLDTARIESGRLEIQRSNFDLEALLAQQLRLLQGRAEAQHSQLRLTMADDAQGYVFGDAQRLTQVLVNLIGNAIKFTAKGEVSVSVQRLGGDDDLLFAVQDSGIGIAPSKHELIFRPFTQADGTVGPMYGGTGLGLSISRSLVQLMGGRIWLDSEPGRGTTFFVQLRLPRVPAPEPPVQASAATLPTPPPQPGSPLHILLCEDTEINVLVVEAMLLPLGHRIDVAVNGALGLHKFSTGRYDLVLMDVQMPGMDGHAATREIRRIEAAEQRRRTPVIALTANAFDADVLRSREVGCDDHLTKPISRVALLEALARHAPTAPPPGDTRAPAAPPQLSSPPPGLDAQLQHGRRRAHARVFLGDWSQSWASANADQAKRLAEDLAAVADHVGAADLCLAAVTLRAALDSDEPTATEQACRQVEAALLPALAELSPAHPDLSV